MEIKGFQGISIVDFPGKISSIVFIARCNFQCPYCYNVNLLRNPDMLPSLPLNELWLLLVDRSPFIEGIVITGGEPTIHQDLPELLYEIRKRLPGKQVKLDTNGSQPSMLGNIIKEKLIDYVALDFKVPFSDYHIVGASDDIKKRWKLSQGLIRENYDVQSYEYRTTVFSPFFNLEKLKEMSKCIQKNEKWFWQNFFFTGQTLEPEFEGKPISVSLLQEWIHQIQAPRIFIRNT